MRIRDGVGLTVTLVVSLLPTGLASAPTLRVSSDPADLVAGLAEYTTIQAAVDAATESGTTILVLPGFGYGENVMVDRGLALRIVGQTGGGVVVLLGGAGTAIDVVSTFPGTPVVVRDLTLAGLTGIRTAVDVVIDGVTLDGTALGVDIDGGTATIEATTFIGAIDGIDLAAGAVLEARRVDLAAPQTGLLLAGSAQLEQVLVRQALTGIIVFAGGTADLRLSTVFNSIGVGIDATGGGAVSLDQSIVAANDGGDVVGLACSAVTLSLIEGVDCTGVNGNLTGPALLYATGEPLVGSPAIDAGLAPSSYVGEPCLDLWGVQRLWDGDDDGLATRDLGAIEHTPINFPLSAVTGLTWSDSETLQWDAQISAVEYHVYRGVLADLGYDDFGVCRDDLDVDRTDTTLIDASVPASGGGWFYLIEAEGSGGVTGGPGLGTCVERSKFAACP